MPLIIISGYPKSGKTYWAKQLAEYFTNRCTASSSENYCDDNLKCSTESNDSPAVKPSTISLTRRPSVDKHRKIHLINDQSLGISRLAYSDTRKEKSARAVQISAIKRVLRKDSIVISDSLNYIKGFRYQLYCEAKNVGTTSCVVHVGTPINLCRNNNAKVVPGEAEDPLKPVAYEPQCFEELILRYEEPNDMTRWDSPLFTVIHDDKSLPFNDIFTSLFGTLGNVKNVRPNMAAIITPADCESTLRILDAHTSDVISIIQGYLTHHPDAGGSEIPITNARENCFIHLPFTSVTMAQLQRLRRQYIQLQRKSEIVLGGSEKSTVHFGRNTDSRDQSDFRSSFVDYLNDEFSRLS